MDKALRKAVQREVDHWEHVQSYPAHGIIDRLRAALAEAAPPSPTASLDGVNIDYLVSRGVTTKRGQELVSAALDWNMDYGMFEVESLTDSLAAIEAELRPAPPSRALDVERLRQAMRNIERRNERAYSWDRDEDALVGEYDRLSSPTTEPVENPQWPRWECSSCTRNANQCDRMGTCCPDCNHDRPTAAYDPDIPTPGWPDGPPGGSD